MSESDGTLETCRKAQAGNGAFSPAWTFSESGAGELNRPGGHILDQFDHNAWSLCTGSSHVIRAVALGVVCLAGLGAIAAAAKKSGPAPAPEVIMPVVAGNKADRLPLAINQDTRIAAEGLDVAYVQPSEHGQAGLSPPAPKEAAVRPHRITPRHWHDPHDLKAKAANKRANSTKQSRKGGNDKPPRQVSDVKECRSDGFDPLLRKLNLSPPCDS